MPSSLNCPSLTCKAVGTSLPGEVNKPACLNMLEERTQQGDCCPIMGHCWGTGVRGQLTMGKGNHKETLTTEGVASHSAMPHWRNFGTLNLKKAKARVLESRKGKGRNLSRFLHSDFCLFFSPSLWTSDCIFVLVGSKLSQVKFSDDAVVTLTDWYKKWWAKLQ